MKRKTKEIPSRWQDYRTLTKPSITGMCVLMTAGGYWLAPGLLDPWHLVVTLLGSWAVVSGSCMLNMYFERDYDRLMKRTSQRPLPSGRIPAQEALMVSLFLSIGGFGILAWTVNLLTACLALFALVSYVFVYTPLKRRSWVALLVGTIPGAIPPLMGWTAVTNQIQLPGLLLFAILVVWQLPHFIALSLMYKHDYDKAGIKTLPMTHGDTVAKVLALGYTLALLPLSLSLVPLRMAGTLYFVVALILGGGFLVIALRSAMPSATGLWARRLFFSSLLYLPLLTLGLVADSFFF